MFLYIRTRFSISQPRIILNVLLYHTIDININANINKIYVERVWYYSLIDIYFLPHWGLLYRVPRYLSNWYLHSLFILIFVKWFILCTNVQKHRILYIRTSTFYLFNTYWTDDLLLIIGYLLEGFALVAKNHNLCSISCYGGERWTKVIKIIFFFR